jgi:hypothetical protein
MKKPSKEYIEGAVKEVFEGMDLPTIQETYFQGHPVIKYVSSEGTFYFARGGEAHKMLLDLLKE